MAFLCPVRMRRDKKKATNANIERDLPLPNVGLGRITGSSSIETLVRVGIEKEHGLSADSKMMVLHDFTPCVDDELEVKRGQIVNILYRENDWVYVIGQDNQEGFIPYSYITADLAITNKKKLPREQASGNGELAENMPLLGVESVKITDAIDELVVATALANGGIAGGTANVVGGNSAAVAAQHSEPTVVSVEPECLPFHKEPLGRYIVLFSFAACDENDMVVERGEFVTVLNRDDADWYWAVRSDGEEGFVPAAYMLPAESLLQTQQKLLNACAQQQEASGGGATAIGNGGAAVVPPTNNLTGTLGATLTQQSLNGAATSNTAATVAATAVTTTVGSALDANNLQSTSLQQQQQQQQQQQSQQTQSQQPPHETAPQLGIGADERYHHGTELVMLYDYKAQAPDDLSVRRGDWIYADLNNQTVDGWLWAYAPKTRKYGFIPKAYARPPAMTSL